MNILISTFGTSWQIIPEILGYCNPLEVPVYDNHSQYEQMHRERDIFKISPIDEVWLATTESRQIDIALGKLSDWHTHFSECFKIRIWRTAGVSELESSRECRIMRDMIYRLVLRATCADNNVYISLAGGRKTMSADIQQAGFLFGCSAILHVVDVYSPLTGELRNLTPDEMAAPLQKELADLISPIVISGRIGISPIIEMELRNLKGKYNILCEYKNIVPGSEDLAGEIEQMQIKSYNLQKNYRDKNRSREKYSNFHEFYLYPPSFLEKLKNDVIGKIENMGRDRELFLRLPKTDLHCHFGGIMSVKEAVRNADALRNEVCDIRGRVQDFDLWLCEVEKCIAGNDHKMIKKLIKGDVKGICSLYENISPPYAMAGFLACFRDNEDILEKLIYGDYLDDRSFCGIGINNYERLGDIQGSGLFQNGQMIRLACRSLIGQCRRYNIRYMEIRCSPENYTRGGLTGREVVEIMLDELCDRDDIIVKILFIASRHGKMSHIYRHIELFNELVSNEKFARNFVGFDLAGSESSRRPAELHYAFLELQKKCIHTTIHAGEGECSDNIWEAIYYLNAERIGHGLSLLEKKELLSKVINQRIALELCPSSNYQIIGFRDSWFPETRELPVYPLADLLRSGVQVTLNTDNPGISRTDIPGEFIKAGRMSPSGLTLWQCLSIIRNGFRNAFLPMEDKKRLILKAEADIIDILKDLY